MMVKAVTPSTKKAATEKATPVTSAKSKTAAAKNPAPAAKTAAPAAKTQAAEAVKPAAKAVAQSPQARYEMISARAYELFAKRGYVHGFDREDWAEAEKQLKLESLN